LFLLACYHNGRLLHKHLLFFFLLLLLVADHSCCYSSPSWSVSTSHHRSLRGWVLLFVCVNLPPFVSCGLRKGFIKLSSFARNSFRVPCWLFQAQ
jgi:hypothetical protein